MKNTEKQRNIGLLFGSFNPIHHGHILLAQAVLEAGSVDEIWFIVSPHNPHKDAAGLAPFSDRFAMVEIAVQDHDYMKACDVENNLPLPSYTYQTLRKLRADYPDMKFSLIVGADVIESILTWKEATEIISRHDFIARDRDGHHMVVPEGVRLSVVPGVFEMSATDVRTDLYNQKLPTAIPQEVLEYIHEHHLYT